MSGMKTVTFPGETPAYRSARAELLEAERALRRQVEAVAAQRRALPPGGALKKDYQFSATGAGGANDSVQFHELFDDGKDTLVIYGFMYAGNGSNPCPMCSAFLDSFDGAASHIGQQINLAVVAKAPPAELQAYGEKRGWRQLRLYSSAGTNFNRDYLAEDESGDQLPMVNVFQKSGDTIRHRYASELFFAGAEPGQNPRHVDMMWPLWQTLDLTPAGRGDWYPSLAYENSSV